MNFGKNYFLKETKGEKSRKQDQDLEPTPEFSSFDIPSPVDPLKEVEVSTFGLEGLDRDTIEEDILTSKNYLDGVFPPAGLNFKLDWFLFDFAEGTDADFLEGLAALDDISLSGLYVKMTMLAVNQGLPADSLTYYDQIVYEKPAKEEPEGTENVPEVSTEEKLKNKNRVVNDEEKRKKEADKLRVIDKDLKKMSDDDLMDYVSKMEKEPNPENKDQQKKDIDAAKKELKERGLKTKDEKKEGLNIKENISDGLGMGPKESLVCKRCGRGVPVGSMIGVKFCPYCGTEYDNSGGGKNAMASGMPGEGAKEKNWDEKKQQGERKDIDAAKKKLREHGLKTDGILNGKVDVEGLREELRVSFDFSEKEREAIVSAAVKGREDVIEKILQTKNQDYWDTILFFVDSQKQKEKIVKDVLEIAPVGSQGGVFYVKINGKKYGYDATDAVVGQFFKLLRHNAGRALAYLKKNAPLKFGAKKFTPGSLGEFSFEELEKVNGSLEVYLWSKKDKFYIGMLDGKLISIEDKSDFPIEIRSRFGDTEKTLFYSQEAGDIPIRASIDNLEALSVLLDKVSDEEREYDYELGRYFVTFKAKDQSKIIIPMLDTPEEELPKDEPKEDLGEEIDESLKIDQEEKKAGDSCKTKDDEEGVLEDKDGKLVCVAKKEKKEENLKIDKEEKKAGDSCKTEDDEDGILEDKDGKLVCVVKKGKKEENLKIDKEEKKAGDPCKMEDEADGVLEDKDGKLVCVAKKEKKEENLKIDQEAIKLAKGWMKGKVKPGRKFRGQFRSDFSIDVREILKSFQIVELEEWAEMLDEGASFELYNGGVLGAEEYWVVFTKMKGWWGIEDLSNSHETWSVRQGVEWFNDMF